MSDVDGGESDYDSDEDWDGSVTPIAPRSTPSPRGYPAAMTPSGASFESFSFDDFDRRGTEQVSRMLRELEDKLYEERSVSAPSPIAAAAASESRFTLEARHNFETLNRPQYAHTAARFSEWTAAFPHLRVLGEAVTAKLPAADGAGMHTPVSRRRSASHTPSSLSSRASRGGDSPLLSSFFTPALQSGEGGRAAEPSPPPAASRLSEDVTTLMLRGWHCPIAARPAVADVEILASHGCVEELLACDLPGTLPVDDKKVAARRRHHRQLGLPPLSPRASMYSEVVDTVFTPLWEAVVRALLPLFQQLLAPRVPSSMPPVAAAAGGAHRRRPASVAESDTSRGMASMSTAASSSTASSRNSRALAADEGSRAGRVGRVMLSGRGRTGRGASSSISSSSSSSHAVGSRTASRQLGLGLSVRRWPSAPVSHIAAGSSRSGQLWTSSSSMASPATVDGVDAKHEAARAAGVAAAAGSSVSAAAAASSAAPADGMLSSAPTPALRREVTVAEGTLSSGWRAAGSSVMRAPPISSHGLPAYSRVGPAPEAYGHGFFPQRTLAYSTRSSAGAAATLGVSSTSWRSAAGGGGTMSATAAAGAAVGRGAATLPASRLPALPLSRGRTMDSPASRPRTMEMGEGMPLRLPSVRYDRSRPPSVSPPPLSDEAAVAAGGGAATSVSASASAVIADGGGDAVDRAAALLRSPPRSPPGSSARASSPPAPLGRSLGRRHRTPPRTAGSAALLTATSVGIGGRVRTGSGSGAGAATGGAAGRRERRRSDAGMHVSRRRPPAPREESDVLRRSGDYVTSRLRVGSGGDDIVTIRAKKLARRNLSSSLRRR
eukprot:PLAT2511.1.p1 GENE.PLAT2511.1~~PLAT2511.1.p1  ORF type:complete len:843 (-),score=226.45 PLAT2511.1:67-2568(-)